MKPEIVPFCVYKCQAPSDSRIIRGHTGKDEEESDLIFGLKLFFNTAFVLFICPFYLSRAETKYVLKNRAWHKAICALYTAIGAIWLVGEIRLSIATMGRRNPGIYFQMAATLVDSFFKAIVLKQFWWNQKDILNICNFVGGNGRWSKPRQLRRIKLVLISLFIFNIGASTVFWSFGTSQELPWTLENWWNGMAARGKFNLFITSGVAINESGVADTIAGTLARIGFYQRRMFGTYTDVQIVTVVLTVHQVVCRFSEMMRSETRWNVVRREYRSLARLCKLLNSHFGANTACLLTFMILTMATGLHEFFFLSDAINPVEKFFLVFYVINSLFVLYKCSNICHQVINFYSSKCMYT